VLRSARVERRVVDLSYEIQVLREAMVTPKSIPSRLHVLLARDSSSAVIIRRGPSRRICVIGWDREADEFTVGQWFYGRIYERRCDLSPDGRHLLYFAMNGKWGSEVLGSWTAVSRAPYIKALGLWPKGDCWNGGGLFISNKEFWLNDGPYGHQTIREAPSLKHQGQCPWPGRYGGECPGVYYVRLQRDGWTFVDHSLDGAGGRIAHFSKRVNDHWSLHKYAHETIAHPVGRGCYFDEHSLYNERTREFLAHPDWEWADIDGARLAWTEQGKLFAGRLERSGMTRVRSLYDFEKLSYERLQAPY
jgi:hypothetical protein